MATPKFAGLLIPNFVGDYVKSVCVIALFIYGIALATTTVAQTTKTVHVGVLLDEPSPWFDETLNALETELNALAGDEFSFVTDGFVFRAEGTRSSAREQLEDLLKNDKVDIIVALGPVGSDIASSVSHSKPVIAAAVISAELQGFPVTELGNSGVPNLHYLAGNIDLVDELNRFKTTAGADKITIAVERSTFDGVPAIRRSLEDLASNPEFGTELVVLDYGPRSSSLAESLSTNSEGVFILPQLARDEAARQDQVNTLIQLGLPSLSTQGKRDASSGFLLALALVPEPDQLARRLAVDIRDLALGRAAADLQVGIEPSDRLVVNMATARVIEKDVPFSILFEAELLNEERGDLDRLSLDDAVNEALLGNLDLAVAQTELESSVEETRIARSDLLPQIAAGVEWEKSDDDLVLLPEVIPNETTTASIRLSQSIYSESVVSSFQSARFLQEAERAGRDTTRLDVVQETATAYLNLLVAKTEREIQRDNIRLTRANLDRARFRYRVGSADRSEVFRFETELASDLQAIATAQSTYDRAIYSLNQILKRPISKPLAVEETGLDSPPLFGDPRLEAFLTGPSRESILADFLTEESLANAPELEELDAEIASQERLLLAAKRRRYVPDVDLVASVEEVVDDSGAPSARDYDEDWQIAVELTLPLYEGSSIAAERRQARVLLRRLRLLREQTSLQLETNARDSVAEASASRLNIEFAKRSEQAAKKTLDLVTDSYTRGRSGYIDVIDAQSTYLTERLASANAVYEYLIDLIDLQRAIGFFDFSIDETSKQAWFDRLETYVRSQP